MHKVTACNTRRKNHEVWCRKPLRHHISRFFLPVTGNHLMQN